tara:strand:- start:318 stop:437 length:120 start_codon:yes stop_codon:yes gene_type:complete
MVHGIEQMIGKVKVFKDGKYQMERPLTESKNSLSRIRRI